MTIPAIAPFAAALVGVTALLLLVSRDWRLSISALGAQYVGVFILVSVVWPLEYAVIKLVAGWIAAAVLGMGLVEVSEAWEEEMGFWISGALFRTFMGGLFGFVVLSLSPDVSGWLPRAAGEQVVGALLLIVLGLLHVGLTLRPVRTTLGLLTILSGFEILYASIEASLLVNAILVLITLGIALTGVYLLVLPSVEVET